MGEDCGLSASVHLGDPMAFAAFRPRETRVTHETAFTAGGPMWALPNDTQRPAVPLPPKRFNMRSAVLLAAEGSLMTRPRRETAKDQVFGALRSAGVAMSAYENLDVVRPLGISAPIIVYRALKLLIGEGLAYRLESTNAYVAREIPSRGAGFAAIAMRSKSFSMTRYSTVCTISRHDMASRSTARQSRFRVDADRAGLQRLGVPNQLRSEMRRT
jgi:hypothetical protein